jgi:hypothetical protein
MHCVGRTSRKYGLDRLALLALWLVQEGIDLIQIEVLALEEVGFLLSKKPRRPFVNPVGDDIFASIYETTSRMCPSDGDGTFAPIYKPLDRYVWLKSRNGKNIRHPNIFKLSILEDNWEVG